MNRANLSIFGAAILVCFARTPPQAQVAESIQLSAGSTIPVMLEKWVDARKNKVGDEIIAKATENVRSEGRVVIPRGSKIVGHVTEAKARTKEESESAVGIVFDHAVLKDGREIPLALTIQAIAPPESAGPSDLSGTPTTAPATAGGAHPVPGGGTTMGPRADPNAGTPGRAASPTNSAYGTAAGLSPTGELTPSCHGVLGIDGLALSPETASPTEGSLIISRRRNVHLDGRTQMMLRVTNRFSPNSNDVSFEWLRRSEQPTAVVHETICEQVHLMSCGCHAMKYGKDLISRGTSTTPTPAAQKRSCQPRGSPQKLGTTWEQTLTNTVQNRDA